MSPSLRNGDRWAARGWANKYSSVAHAVAGRAQGLDCCCPPSWRQGFDPLFYPGANFYKSCRNGTCQKIQLWLNLSETFNWVPKSWGWGGNVQVGVGRWTDIVITWSLTFQEMKPKFCLFRGEMRELVRWSPGGFWALQTRGPTGPTVHIPVRVPAFLPGCSVYF